MLKLEEFNEKNINFKYIKIKVKVYFFFVLLTIICSLLGIHQVPSDLIPYDFHTSTMFGHSSLFNFFYIKNKQKKVL